MKIDDDERNEISRRKEAEKSSALEDLYSSIGENAKMAKNQEKPKTQAETSPETRQKESRKAVESAEKKKNQIWDDDDFEEPRAPEPSFASVIEEERPTEASQAPLPPREKPKEREKRGAIQMPFTEKIYNHLATREQHFLDPPMPKTKGNPGSQNNPDLQDNNPLWLKDKGDEFYKNGDYASAANAYTMALAGAPELLPALSNRSSAFLHLMNIRSALDDSKEVLGLITKMAPEKQADPKIKIIKEKSEIRIGICELWNGRPGNNGEQRLREALERLSASANEPEDVVKAKAAVCEKLKEDLEGIETKRKRTLAREEADSLLRSGKAKEAAESYEKLIEEDGSFEEEEYFFSNWSLALLKSGELEKCIQICERGLLVYEKFRDFHKMRETFLRSSLMENHTSPIEFKLKLMYRQADALIKLGRTSDGEQKIKEILRIDELNEEARILQEKLLSSKKLKDSIEMKKQGNSLVQQRKFREALQLYTQALSGIDRSSDFNEYLAVLMNQTVCHMELKLWDELISAATRAISMVEMRKSRVMKFEGENRNERASDLDKFLERLFVRRGNAYLEKGQIYNAKLDLGRVVELNPGNNEAKGTLEKLGKFESKV